MKGEQVMKALITGASSGIGREIAIYLSELGVDLIVVARRKDRLEELKSILKTNVEIICMDVSSAENCIELYKQVKNVDILVNNAGFGTFGEFEKTSIIEEMEMVNTNICAVHTLTKLFLKDMKEKDEGYILNVASIAAFLPGPLMATYYSTKAYVFRLTESIYEELRREGYNVSVSILCPGPTKTEFMGKAGVSFKTRYSSSKYVARYGRDKMFKGKLIILPGIKTKLVRFFGKVVPDKLLARVAYNIQEKRK